MEFVTFENETRSTREREDDGVDSFGDNCHGIRCERPRSQEPHSKVGFDDIIKINPVIITIKYTVS